MKKEKYNAILGKILELKVVLNDEGGGNPYHDELGRFTTGPGGKKGPKISKDAQAVFDEEDDLTDGAYKKDLNAIFEEFSGMGVDMNKIKFETNIDNLPEGMQWYIGKDKDIKGCATAKKNLESLIWLDEDMQLDYVPVDGNKKWLDGKELKDQPFTTNGTAMGVIRHELGHIASYTLFINGSGRKQTKESINVGAARLDINARFKKIFGNNYDFNKLKLSRYGLTNSGEAVAEAFSNPNFSEDTRKIYDYYKRELSKLKATNARKTDSGWVILCDGYPTEGGVDDKISKLNSKLDSILATKNGGKGSGNFGHSGRLGMVGGSGKGGTTKKSEGQKVDSEGNELSKEQEEYFKDSKIRDEKGNLRLLFHGSPSEDIEEFDEGKAGSNTRSGEKAFFFTDSKNWADEFSYERIPTDSLFFEDRGKKGKIYEGYLNIKNPLDLGKMSEKQISDMYEYASELGKLDGKDKFVQRIKKWQRIGNDQLIKVQINLEKFKKSNYDGMIARMEVGSDSKEYIVFDSSQFKLKDNKKPTKSKKIGE